MELTKAPLDGQVLPPHNESVPWTASFVDQMALLARKLYVSKRNYNQVQEICERHGITTEEEFDRIMEDPQFKEAYEGRIESLKRSSSMGFRTAQQLIAAENMEVCNQMIRDPTVPASTRADLIKFQVKEAANLGAPSGNAAPVGTVASITINLG